MVDPWKSPNEILILRATFDDTIIVSSTYAGSRGPTFREIKNAPPRYGYFGADGKEIKDDTLTCDVCGCDVW